MESDSSAKNKSSAALPPVKALFSEAWSALTASLLNLFLIGLSNLALVFIFAAVVFTGVFALGLYGHNPQDFTKVSALVRTYFWPGAAVLAFLVVAFSVVQTTMMAATIIAVGEHEKKPHLPSLLSRGLRLVIPLFLTSIIVSVLSFGASILLFIPGIIFGIFFSFVSYEVVLAGKKYSEAVRGSVRIIAQHFGDIFVRFLLFFLLSTLIVLVIPAVIRAMEPKDVQIFSSIIPFIINLILGWYGTAFSIILYRQASATTDVTKKVSLLWFWVVSLIGWVIFVLISLAVFSVLAPRWNTILQSLNQKKAAATDINEVLTTAPSSCGLSIPIPKTTDEKNGKPRKWTYEESSMSKSSFYLLDNDVFVPERIVGSFLSFKSADQKLADTVANVGINVYCVDNTKKYSLDEFKSLALASKKYKVTFKNRFRFGEVDLDNVNVDWVEDGKPAHDILYLGVSRNANKLIQIRLWDAGSDEVNLTQLKKDQQTIYNNLKYRDDTTKLINMTFETDTTPANAEVAAPSCTRYNIREGEFASNKCYSGKDYQDLVYYIDRFNSAVFSLNGANGQMSVTCNGSDFFKAQCDKNKQEKSQAESDMAKYRAIINGIIGRGAN